MKEKLEKWLKKQGYRMVSVNEYAEIEGIAQRTAYQRLNNNKVEHIKIDGTKVLLVKEK